MGSTFDSTINPAAPPSFGGPNNEALRTSTPKTFKASFQETPRQEEKFKYVTYDDLPKTESDNFRLSGAKMASVG